MEIYVLEPTIPKARCTAGTRDNPWHPWYDKCFGMVVIACNASQARKLAAENCDDEGPLAWLKPAYTKIVKIGSTHRCKQPYLVLKNQQWA